LVGTAITTLNSGNYARLDLQVNAKFVRLLLKTRTNAVNLTAKISQR